MSSLHVQCTLLNRPRQFLLVVASLGDNRDVVVKLGYFSMMAAFSVSTGKRECRRSAMVLSGLTRWFVIRMVEFYCQKWLPFTLMHSNWQVCHRNIVWLHLFSTLLYVLAQTECSVFPYLCTLAYNSCRFPLPFIQIACLVGGCLLYK